MGDFVIARVPRPVLQGGRDIDACSLCIGVIKVILVRVCTPSMNLVLAQVEAARALLTGLAAATDVVAAGVSAGMSCSR